MRLPVLPCPVPPAHPPADHRRCRLLALHHPLPADEGRAAKGSKKEKPMYLKDVMFKQALEGDISSGGWVGGSVGGVGGSVGGCLEWCIALPACPVTCLPGLQGQLSCMLRG
jgi:hypothetical protein